MTQRPLTLLAAALLCLAPACAKAPAPAPPPPTAPPPSPPSLPAAAPVAEPPRAVSPAPPVAAPLRGVAAQLVKEQALQAPRSTSAHLQPWPLPGAEPRLVLLSPTHVQAAGKTLVAMRCRTAGGACRADQAEDHKHPKQLSFDSEDLDPPARGLSVSHGTVGALTTATAAWRGRSALVMVDRRMPWLAVQQVLRTLRRAGVRGLLGAVDAAGRVVTLGHARPLPEQAVWRPAKRAHTSPKGPGPMPDLRTIEILLESDGGWLTMRGARTSRRIRLRAPVGPALAAHARWLLTAHPALRGVRLIADDTVPYATVVAAVDALRDDCPSTSQEPCTAARRLFAVIELGWTGDWLEADEADKAAGSTRNGGDPPAAGPLRPILPAGGGVPSLMDPHGPSRHTLGAGRPQP